MSPHPTPGGPDEGSPAAVDPLPTAAQLDGLEAELDRVDGVLAELDQQS